MNDERLDGSAIVHMTSRGRDYTNTFQVSATLCKPVDPDLLQQALECIAPRFSALLTGIRRGRFQYEAVPAAPRIQPEWGTLASMSDDVLELCALRVLYCESKISVEGFLTLTDVFGGLSLPKGPGSGVRGLGGICQRKASLLFLMAAVLVHIFTADDFRSSYAKTFLRSIQGKPTVSYPKRLCDSRAVPL